MSQQRSVGRCSAVRDRCDGESRIVDSMSDRVPPATGSLHGSIPPTRFAPSTSYDGFCFENARQITYEPAAYGRLSNDESRLAPSSRVTSHSISSSANDSTSNAS